MSVQGVFYWMPVCAVFLLCLTDVPPAAALQSDRSYYETLNVERSAAGSHIKKAFRKLAIKYHPDKNKSAGAEKTFREIVEAYTVLSNKEKRRLYDTLGHKAFLENDVFVHSEDEHETSFPFDFESFFHDFDHSPFMEEPFGHWTFPLEGEDEDNSFQHYNIEKPGFTFYFGDDEEEGPFF